VIQCVRLISENHQIHIVDDDEAIRSSLTMLFESVGKTVTTHNDGQDFLAHCEQHSGNDIGCIVLDIRMPGIGGMDLFKQLKPKGIHAPVIFITGHGDVQMAVQAMHRGAFDFILKPFRDQDLLDSVNAALEQAKSDAAASEKLSQIREHYRTLTDREREVLREVAAGKANKAIAADLNLSQRTVEIHRSRVMEKMQVKSLADLIRAVVCLEQNNAIPPPD